MGGLGQVAYFGGFLKPILKPVEKKHIFYCPTIYLISRLAGPLKMNSLMKSEPSQCRRKYFWRFSALHTATAVPSS